MRLSEYNSVYKSQFLFLKFMNEKDHIQSLQNGNLRCGTGKIYRDIEKKQQKKGVGDRYEGLNVVTPTKPIQFHEPDTEELQFELKVRELTFSIDEFLHMPVFSLYGLSSDDLEVFDEDEESYHVKTVFDEEDKALLQKDFGEHVLIIHTIFLERVIQRIQGQETAVIYGFVKYDDFSKTNIKRLASSAEDAANVLFWKNEKDFKHQKEYRIVLDAQITDYKTYDIGDLHDCTIYMTREKLFTEGFRFRIAKI